MSTTKKKVCIVGAGPSGLVAAKVLLNAGQFEVTIYEKSDRLGGVWAIDRRTANGWLNSDTPTNVSRFSVAFSDFQWDPSFVGTSETHPNSSHIPMFPKAWQVNRYLEAYRKKHIPDEVLRLNHQVVKTERQSGKNDPKWRVTTRNKTTDQSDDFDFLLLASGFFAKPRSIEHTIPALKNREFHSSVKILHSSAFRTLSNIFPDRAQVRGRTILMIGAGNSAGETAAAIAQCLSDSQYAPDVEEQQRCKDFKIVHITPRPIYALPPYHPAGDDYRTFVPLDFRFYDLSKRPAGAIVAGAGRQPQTLKDMMHNSLQSVLGGNQSELGSPAITVPTSEPRGTVNVALTESYSEFVRSRMIEVIRGRVTSLEDGENSTMTAQVQTADNGLIKVHDIAAIVYASGFTRESAVEFLPDDVKRGLHYDPTSLRLPLILGNWQTATQDFPDLAVLGFYEGPFWGVIEMQARLTAARWSGEIHIARNSYEDYEKLLDVRKGMSERGLDVPQYWFGDYLGYLEEVALHLKLQRNDGHFQQREGCALPARYLSADSDKKESDETMKDLFETWQACTKQGKFVPRAAFRALQGSWKIRRIINSASPAFPSGTLEGTANFHPRSPTKDKSGYTADLEYLYIESGTLTMSTGYSMPARRRYVYRYSEIDDQLSVWFVKPDKELEVDYHFHDLKFSPPEEARAQGACIATADYLCVEDMYWTKYRLPIKGVSLLEFETTHTVKGPSKDYVATTLYTRPPAHSVD